MKAKKKQLTPMDKLTAGYEDFIKHKEQNKNGAANFENTLKKATTVKRRGSK